MKECPRCGDPISSSTIIGPGEARVSPCGCRVAPEEVIDDD